MPEDEGRRKERCETILEIQSGGLKKRIEHTNSKTAVIGISADLIASLALLVTVQRVPEVKPPDDGYFSGHDAVLRNDENERRATQKRLCEAIGTSFMTVDIKNSCQTSHFEDIGHDINNA